VTLSVLLVGDSHTEALGRALPPLLERQGMRVVHVAANRGKSTAWYVADGKLGALVRQYRPDVAIVVLGTNDQPNANYIRTLQSAVEQIRQAGTSRIVWFGPPYAPAVEERVAAIRMRQEGTLPQLGVSWYDSWPMTTQGHAPDRVHFTAAGYQAWATSMADELAILPRSGAASSPSGAIVWPILALASAIFFVRVLR
jgi:lysophospholipase L1-like esterase